MSSRVFTCAVCQGTFQTSAKEAEVEKEFENLYGHTVAESDEDVVRICTSCYQAVLDLKEIRSLAKIQE